MPKNFLIEACVETIEEALEAEKKGADRIEFCSALQHDGLTPNFDTTQSLLQYISIPVMVMIRPRKGDFEYSKLEIEHMKSEIRKFHNLAISGFVFGVTQNKNSLNINAIQKLVEVAKPRQVCIHKAIDQCTDIIREVKVLNKLDGISRILSSGAKPTALEGAEVLIQMKHFAKKGMEIMPAGKITFENLNRIHAQINASSYHGRKIV